MPSTASITKAIANCAALTLCLGVASLSHAGLVDVYTCKDGGLTTVRLSPSQSQARALISSGNAIWASRMVDGLTINAVAEGRGVWGLAPVQTIFQILSTKTHPSYLAAIANQESGRNGRFWPWTINYAGKGHFYSSKQQAVAAAKNLIAQGVRIFDIGMMQVNWRYHAHRFESLDTAFDPDINVRVADAIVQQHLRETGSIQEAIGRYHSKTPSLKTKYLRKLDTHLRLVTQTTNLERTQPC